MSTTRSMIWVDTTGKTRMTLANVVGASVGTIQADLMALSNAVVEKWWEGSLTIPGGAPAAAQFLNVQDYADLLFQSSADGSIARLTLPAPLQSIFLADLETVDPTAIAVLIADVTVSLLTGTGQIADTYLGGVRRRKMIDY